MLVFLNKYYYQSINQSIMKKHDFRRKEEQFVHWFAFRNMKDKLYVSKYDISSTVQARVIRRQLIVPIVI